jgi:GNAT superfamily N-acetyltransferase
MAFESSLGIGRTSLTTHLHSPTLSIRRATIEDLDSMVDIALAAMPQDPQWNWRFPYRLQFPEDTRRFTRMKYEEFLRNADGQWLVMLADGREIDSLSPKAVAMAIWNIQNLLAAPRGNAKSTRKCERVSKAGSDQSYTTCRSPAVAFASTTRQFRVRRDANAVRVKAFAETLAQSKKIIFDGSYGRRHFTLQVLATRPGWQRKGAGTMLCNWGIKMSLWTGMAISVFASPMGRKLYSHLGFRPISEVKLAVDGDDESVAVLAMSYEADLALTSGRQQTQSPRRFTARRWTDDPQVNPRILKVWNRASDTLGVGDLERGSVGTF